MRANNLGRVLTNISIHRPHLQMAKKDEQSTKPRGLQNKYEYIPDSHVKFAKAMESQFAELMLKEMQKTSGASNTDQATQFYQDLLVKERSNAMADRGSGIKDMILDEVYPKRYRNKANYDAYQNQINSFKKQKVEMHDHPKQDIKLAAHNGDRND